MKWGLREWPGGHEKGVLRAAHTHIQFSGEYPLQGQSVKVCCSLKLLILNVFDSDRCARWGAKPQNALVVLPLQSTTISLTHRGQNKLKMSRPIWAPDIKKLSSLFSFFLFLFCLFVCFFRARSGFPSIL